jgi:hypothetical protein
MQRQLDATPTLKGDEIMGTLFIIFVAAIVMLLAAGFARYLSPGQRGGALLGLIAWIAYGGAFGYTGVLANRGMMPPGMFYLLAPAIVFVMFMARSRIGEVVALSFPLWLLMGFESFRLVVELFLHRLSMDGQIPKMLTYQGANYDILIGVSAPFVAWLLLRQKISSRTALLWNILGIALLANVAVRGVLTTPGPLHFIPTEVPNVAISTFPFTYIPGLMVPLALMLHVLSIRALRHRMAIAASPAGQADRRSSGMHA